PSPAPRTSAACPPFSRSSVPEHPIRLHADRLAVLVGVRDVDDPLASHAELRLALVADLAHRFRDPHPVAGPEGRAERHLVLGDHALREVERLFELEVELERATRVLPIRAP